MGAGLSQKFDFKNAQGETLSGRLELPATEPAAFAIFAHCFTCTKNILAASRISKALNDFGIGVLRFDFTGLGNSEGDFSNTNFSSNVRDLEAAYFALAQEFKAPKIMIGHSLGGAAVLKSSLSLPEVDAVVTIGAPSDTHHILKNFEQSVPAIESHGLVEVRLAGKLFTIKKQFLDDVREQELLQDLQKSKKAFLVLHSPTDNTVSVEHAAKIFGALRHPKSFVSLDQADHLLSKAEDSSYVAQVIGAWVGRYVKLH